MKIFFGKIFPTSKPFIILSVLIFFLAVFLRTHNYRDRISIISDNSRDVQVAAYAADNFKIPLTGNFASAGPFFYGPWWYLFLELVSFLPFGVLKYWYAATFISIFFILLTYKVGEEIGGKLLGFIAALFAAISPAQIQNSLTVWNPSITPLLVLLSLFFAIRSVKNFAIYNIFFLGFFVSLAFTIHFQNMLIFPIPIVTLAIIFVRTVSRKKFLLLLPALLLGLFLPLIPLLYFDFSHFWFNSRNFLIYLLVDQYKIWTPNRWLTYAFNYWPQTVSNIVGGA